MKDAKTELLRHGITVICRRLYGEKLYRLSDALYRGGIRLIEVTFDQEDPDCMQKTEEAIRGILSRHPDMTVGGGTVLHLDQAKAILRAGGSFSVSPNTNPSLITEIHALGLCVIPGAMTPSEIEAAWEAGADLVKLFPAAYLGIDFVRYLKAPLGHIPLFAAGGIKPDNLEAFLRAGCRAAGISSYLTDRALLEADDMAEFTRRAQTVCRIFEGVYPEMK